MRPMEGREMKKYLRLIWIEFKKGKEYSLNFIGKLMYMPFKLLIIYFIWKYIFINTQTIENYTFQDMILYYFLLEIIQIAIQPVGFTAYEVWKDINQGRVNLFLSRPIFYPIYSFFTKIGGFIWGILSGIIFLLIANLLSIIDIHFEIVRIFYSIQSAFFGLIIMYTLFFCVGALTFWVENVLTLRDNLWNVIRILSGQILPLALFPGFFRNIAQALPFQYIYYVPISIFQGKISGTGLYRILTGQALWTCSMIFLSIILWKVGSKRYTAQGG